MVETTPELTAVEMTEILKDVARHATNAAARIAAIKQLLAMRAEDDARAAKENFAGLYALASPPVKTGRRGAG